MPEDTEKYLGDGLYVRVSGAGTIWLRSPRDDGDHLVALEPEVFAALCAFAEENGLLATFVRGRR